MKINLTEKDIGLSKKKLFKIWDNGYLLIWIPDTPSVERELSLRIENLRTIYQKSRGLL